MDKATSPANAQSIRVVDLPVLFDDLRLDALDAPTLERLWQIDALLPQTQCGLCGYADGCLPYAHAIATKNEAINLCVPGGDPVSKAIAALTDRPFLPAKASKWPVDPATRRPIAARAVIDEAACIGCTKCLPACPVDAIVGTAKHMHSVATTLCTGCELCLAPCPVDCIAMEPAPSVTLPDPSDLRAHYHAHLKRLSQQIQTNQNTLASHTQSKIANRLANNAPPAPDAKDAKAAIQAAKLRSQIKKLSVQVGDDPQKKQQLAQLRAQLEAL